MRRLDEARALRAAGRVKKAEARERAAEAAQLAGTKPSTINRNLVTLRAMLKRARPDFRFPGRAFFKEDDTRVRWLRPEEELLVLEPMPSPFREMATTMARFRGVPIGRPRRAMRGWLNAPAGRPGALRMARKTAEEPSADSISRLG
jgi:hypothetical protein